MGSRAWGVLAVGGLGLGLLVLVRSLAALKPSSPTEALSRAHEPRAAAPDGPAWAAAVEGARVAEPRASRSVVERADTGVVELEAVLEEPAEPAGPSVEQLATRLRERHESYHRTLGPHTTEDAEARVRAELNLATLCVAIHLRSEGRAESGEPGSDAMGSSHALRPRADGWQFLALGARFEFDRGEFPAYDSARARYADLLAGSAPARDDEDRIGALETLFQGAARRLD
jgi:hypothetical protein